MNYYHKRIFKSNKKKVSVFIFFGFFISSICFSQKGATPLFANTSSLSTPSKTYAVIIGISDYQDPAIPDLKYADKDAIAFSHYLTSFNDGKIPDENIKLLKNEEATTAQIYKYLDWLVDVCKEGDLAIIYFSGHGDVESKYRNQPGFLLCYDSPPKSYIGGALNIRDISENIIPTLSIDRKSRVLLITDACRAGKLAGSYINGSQLTAQTFTTQFANEVKILSCQPNEYSHEDSKWGGGRGVFSYHLVEGLTGLADNNGNSQVTLSEIDRYLEDHVAVDVSPNTQTPMIVGNKNEVITNVNQQMLEQLKSNKTNADVVFINSDIRSIYEGLPADSFVRKNLIAFDKAILEKRYIVINENCAAEIIEQICSEDPKFAFCGNLKRILAAAIQDEVQQAFNSLLSDDPYETNNWILYPEKYKLYPDYLQKAIELLGVKHYKIPSLLAKKNYFEAYLLLNNQISFDSAKFSGYSMREVVKEKLIKAINLDPQAAYLYHLMAAVHFNTNPAQTDSVVFYNTKATQLSPTWLLPYMDIIMEYQVTQNDFAKGEAYLLEAQKLNPNSYLVQERLSWFKQWQGKLEEAIAICKKMIEQKPDLFNAYNSLSHTYWIKGDHINSIYWAKKSLDINDSITVGFEHIISSLMQTRKFNYAMSLADSFYYQFKYSLVPFEGKCYLSWYLKNANKLQSALNLIHELDFQSGNQSMYVLAKVTEGIVRYKLGDVKEAEKIFTNSLLIDPFRNPFYVIAYAWLGVISADEGNYTIADSLFNVSIQSSSGNWMDDFIAMDEAHYLYGQFLLSQKRYKKAEDQFLLANHIRSQNGYQGWYGLACLQAALNNEELALDFLEKSLNCYYPIPEPILEEPLFNKIRKTKRFKELMKKHFENN